MDNEVKDLISMAIRVAYMAGQASIIDNRVDDKPIMSSDEYVLNEQFNIKMLCRIIQLQGQLDDQSSPA